MVWAAEAGRSCGGKQDELLHVSGAHEYGAAAIFGVRSLENKFSKINSRPQPRTP